MSNQEATQLNLPHKPIIGEGRELLLEYKIVRMVSYGTWLGTCQKYWELTPTRALEVTKKKPDNG